MQFFFYFFYFLQLNYCFINVVCMTLLVAESAFGVSLCHAAVEGAVDDKDKYEM